MLGEADLENFRQRLLQIRQELTSQHLDDDKCEFVVQSGRLLTGS